MMKNILTAVLLALLLTCSACTGCNAPAGEPGLSQSGKELSSAADEGTEDTEEIIAAEAISTETEEKRRQPLLKSLLKTLRQKPLSPKKQKPSYLLQRAVKYLRLRRVR